MKIEENEVYTTKELAQILKISLPTVKRMLKDKRLTSTRVGKQHRFLGRDILQILAAQQDLRTPPVTAAAGSVQPSYDPDYVDKLTSTERRQRAYMLGKKLASDLYSDYGVLIVEAGRVVDDEVIQTVRAHRKMMELFTRLEHGE
ncbi:MAG: helix-turn-helix domain-containing protein [bacterium]